MPGYPHVWKKAGIYPEALGTFGSPWILGAKPGTARLPDNFILPGMGSFVYALQGSPFILVTFRYHDCFGRGQDMAHGVKWVLSMNQANFKAFAANACTGALLTPGAIAWIPYGFAAVLVTKATSFQPSIALQVPFF